LIPIMTIPFINYMVEYQWQKFRDYIEWRRFFFNILFITYSIFSLSMVQYKNTVHSITENTPAIYDLWYLFVIIMMISIAVVNFIIEVANLFKRPIEYLSQLWKWVDLLCYSLSITVVWFHLNDSSPESLRVMASVTLILYCVKMFYYMRANEQTSQLIRIIIEMIVSMKNFLSVFFICIFGIAGGFFIMQNALYKDGLNDDDLSKAQFAGTNIIMAVIYTYRLSLGDFQLDSLDSFENPIERYFIWTVFLLSSLFMVVVLLNLLITIMGTTYSDLSSMIMNLQIREKVMFISENELLVTRTQIFKNS
jgi:Ion transport protein